jgi:hypothetical protein
MLSHFSQKNLLSSSFLVLSLFLLSPEGKAMEDDIKSIHVCRYPNNLPTMRKTYRNMGVSQQYDFDMPNAPVIHPYNPNNDENKIRTDSGVPTFFYALRSHNINNWPDFQKVLQFLKNENIDLNNCDVSVVVQNDPWKKTERALKPQSWAIPDAPFLSEKPYHRVAKIRAALISPHESVELLKDGLVKNGEFIDENIISHNAVSFDKQTQKYVGSSTIVSSGNSLILQGVEDEKNSLFWSIVTDTTNKKTAVTLHAILNDKDIEKLHEKNITTLDPLMKELNKLYYSVIKVERAWKSLPIDWDNSPNRERFPKKAIVKEENGEITLTTDCSGAHLYQCESQNLKNVNPGDTLRFSYDIEGEAQGLTLILRNKTHQRPLPGAIFPLQNGVNKKQDLQFIIPEGAKDISVLLYNDKIIDSKKLKISSLKLEKLGEIIENGRKSLPIDWDNSSNRERFPKKAIVKEENGKIILTTDCSQSHLYQLESQNLKDVNPGDTLRFSYDIEGKAQGLTLILRNKTHQRPIPGAFFALQNGVNKKQDLQFIIPEGAKDISVLLYNEAIIPSATLTINELKIEKEENPSIVKKSVTSDLKVNLPPIPKITFQSYFNYLFEGIYQEEAPQTEWTVLNGDAFAGNIKGEIIPENTAFSTPQSTLLSVNDIDSLKRNADKNDFKGDPKKYIQLMDQIAKNIEKDEKAFFVIFDFNYNGKKSINESVIFIYKEIDNVKNEPSPSGSKNSSLSLQRKRLIRTVANVFAKEGKKNITQVDITNLLNNKPEFARKSIQTRIDNINQVLGGSGFLDQANEELIKIKNVPLPESEEEKIKKVMNNKEIVNISFERLMKKTKKALHATKRDDYSNARDVINKILKANLWDSLDIKSKDYIISLCAPKKNKNIISNNINISNNTNINFQEIQSNAEDARLEVEELINKDVVNELSLVVSNIKKKDSIRPAGDIIKNYLESFVRLGSWEKLSLEGQKYLVSLCDPEKKKEIVFEPIRKNIIEERFDPRNQIHVKPQIDPLPNDFREQNREVVSFENEKFYVYNVSTVQVNCGYFTLDTTREKAREVLRGQTFNKRLKEPYCYMDIDSKFQRELQYDAIHAESLCIIGRYVVGANIRVFGRNENNKLYHVVSTERLGIGDPNLPTINILNENIHYKILVPTDNTEENNLLRAYGREKEDLELKDRETEKRLAYIEDNNTYEKEYEKWGNSHFLNNKKGGVLKSYVEWVKSLKK